MRRLLDIVERVATPLLLVCALTVTGLVVRGEFFAPPSAPLEPTDPVEGRPLPENVRLKGGQLIGEASSPIRLVEFADFQCPFCARAASSLEKLSEQQPGQFVIEFHHMPIPGHAFAMKAAEAAECAGEQGRFAAFYSDLYGHQDKVGHWAWAKFAERVGVRDLGAFNLCMQSGRLAHAVENDVKIGKALGVRGTPTWIVGDSVYGGLPPTVQLKQWVSGR